MIVLYEFTNSDARANSPIGMFNSIETIPNQLRGKVALLLAAFDEHGKAMINNVGVAMQRGEINVVAVVDNVRVTLGQDFTLNMNFCIDGEDFIGHFTVTGVA